jgi:hypothetical protein
MFFALNHPRLVLAFLFEQVGMQTHDAKVIFDKVQKLYTVIKDMGNPFMEETGGLFTLHTTIITHPSVAEMVVRSYSLDWQNMKIVENRQSSFNVFCFEPPAFGSGFC